MERDRTKDEEESEDKGPVVDPSAMAVYGDTDMDPNRDDQASAHHAEEDEHL